MSEVVWRKRFGYPNTPFMVIDEGEQIEVVNMATGRWVYVPEDLWREIVLAHAAHYTSLKHTSTQEGDA